VGFACPGEWIAIGSGSVHTHTAEALVDSLLRPMSRAERDRRMRQEPEFLSEMLEVAAGKLQEAEEQMVLLGQRSALEKVASFLVTFARRLQPDGDGVRLPMDRADIADYLGLTIETVSRKFTQLKHAGVIALATPSCVRVCDPWTLQAVADGDRTIH
jgi:CRP/FNR family transcriptional regulator